ncbi:hypothetical protein BpHYR1_052463 [Brachionus plicatilis]|uniref:Uncharacterized protein n=1 Tax=Brachionus plicatilis TaxID=10195 RepID=A0A3M7QZG6_BRAPC|nr:hypothetical protein BpHYR1_052463 [Brachionus plicatilis]
MIPKKYFYTQDPYNNRPIRMTYCLGKLFKHIICLFSTSLKESGDKDDKCLDQDLDKRTFSQNFSIHPSMLIK